MSETAALPPALHPSLAELFRAFAGVSISAFGGALPKAEIDTPAKARNSSASEGCKTGGDAAGSDICTKLHGGGARD